MGALVVEYDAQTGYTKLGVTKEMRATATIVKRCIMI